jgi:hypothetical protein
MLRAALLALATTLVVVLPSAAAVIDRVRVTEAGGAVTKSLPPSVFVSIASPAEYVRAASSETAGRWVGPRYQATANSTRSGESTIAWHLRFAEGAKDAEAAANAVEGRGWPVDIKGGVSIPHVIRGNAVGTVLGYYLLTRAPGSSSAAYEAALAFPVGPRLYALLRFELLEPGSDDAGRDGRYVVKGIPASIWNRGQAFWSITSVRLEGNLAPARVSARIAAGGRAIRGRVSDSFRHPVVAARVRLELETGAGWSAVASTTTDGRGAYVLPAVSKRGRYRVAATLGTARARSRAIVAGPSGSAPSRSFR